VNTLFVGNLSYSVADPDLQALFAQFNRVKAARVVVDRLTGRSRGFGFIELATPLEASKAMASLSEHEFRGRRLIVTSAKVQSEHPA